MRESTPESIKKIVEASARGERRAAEELLPLVYGELRRLAQSKMSALPPGQTLGATALVHEAYLRLVGDGDPGWDHRGHFFASAARAMRDILVEQYRRKNALKRGGDRKRVDTTEIDVAHLDATEDFLAVHEALLKLEREDPRKSALIDLRYFVGLSARETASILGVSERTVEREWRYVRAWLRAQLQDF